VEGLAFFPKYVIHVKGYPEDSPQGYAARVIDCLANIDLAARSEDIAFYGRNAFDLALLVK
jgi:hypothetical protein